MLCLVTIVGRRYSCKLSVIITQSTLIRYRSALFGGIYAQNHTQWTDSDLIEAMTVDVTSRMINNIWAQQKVYVQFTDLGDGETPYLPFL